MPRMKGALVTVFAMSAWVHAAVYYEAEENRQDIRETTFEVPTDYQISPKTTASGRRPTRAGPNP